MAIKKITLENGFNCKVDPAALDNMELVELLAVLEDDPLKMPAIINMVLGAEQKAALYDHIRDDAGRVPVEAVNEAMSDIFTKMGEDAKN